MVAIDLPDLHTGCRVAVAEMGILPVAVHYRRVGTGRAGHFDTGQEQEVVMLPDFHCAGDRTEGWQGASPRNWRGTVPACR